MYYKIGSREDETIEPLRHGDNFGVKRPVKQVLIGKSPEEMEKDGSDKQEYGPIYVEPKYPRADDRTYNLPR